MKQNKFWLKLLGLALLIHIVLIVISVLEVIIYSYLIAPGKAEAFYQEHAENSGPWISGIFGSLFIFLLVRRFTKRQGAQGLMFAIALPLFYMLIDLVILYFFQIDWKEHLAVFAIANGVKIISALLAYYLYKPPLKVSG